MVCLDIGQALLEPYETRHQMCTGRKSTTSPTSDNSDSTQAWVGLLVQLILPSEKAMGYAACASFYRDPDQVLSTMLCSLRPSGRLHDSALPPCHSEPRSLRQYVFLLRFSLGMGELFTPSVRLWLRFMTFS
jgi:hypothetical protein